jgi:transcriptional regulator with GAF, ATPase, and Fis domain
VRAARVGGVDVTVVLERERALEGEAAIELGPLSDEAIMEVLRGALGIEPSPALVRAAAEASGGLAGRLCRLLAAGLAAERELSRPEAMRALGAEIEVASALDLPESTRAIAERVAVAGGTLAAEALGELQQEHSQVGSGFKQLVADGLATVTETGALHLREDIARAIRRALDPETRRAHADSLKSDTLGPPARGFVALARGDAPGADREFVEAIERRRRAGDPEGAIRLAEDVLTELAPQGSDRIRLLHADALRARGRYPEALAALQQVQGPDAALLRAEIARLSGDPDASAQHAAQARAEGSAAVRVQAQALEARLAFDAGDLERADALARAAWQDADSGGLSAQAIRAMEGVALVHLARGEREHAGRCATEAVVRARRAGDRLAESRARALAATVALGAGAVLAGARGFVDAFELAEQAGELHAAASFLVNVGLARLDAGELGPAVTALREGARRLARLERDHDLARALYNLANAALIVGDDELARSAVQRGREAAERVGDAVAHAWASVVQTELDLRAGRLEHAARTVNEAWERVTEGPASVRAVVAARRALIEAKRSEADAAERSIEQAMRAAEEAGTDATQAEWRTAAAQVSIQRGNREAAQQHVDAARSAAERTGSFELRLRALLTTAEVAEAERDRDRAAHAWSQARSLLDGASNTLEPAARARFRSVAAYERAFSAVPVESSAAGEGDDRWRKLTRYAKRLTAERRVARLYEEILDAAVEISGAERGFLVLRETDGRLRVRVARGMDRRALFEEDGQGDAQAQRTLSRSIVARAIDGGQTLATVDALEDERLGQAASVHALALRSVAAVPLRLRGEVQAALYLDDRLRPGAFGPHDVALLEDLAELSAIALDGAETLRRERRQARRLSVLQRRLERTVQAQGYEIDTLKRTSGGGDPVAGIVARSEPMRQTLDLALRVADSDVPAIVTGESGTGKELVARAIHLRSPRRDRRFVSENCSAIPEPLLESTLFGHVRGAFTGADRNRVGLFEAAHGGTLLLDEIGEMSQAMQAKLLRTLQDGVVRPVGSERTRKVDVRIVAATHRDLEAMVARGEFRQDLYYRLAVVAIAIPPLRDRPDDIPPLVAHFVDKHAQGRSVRVERRALAQLQAYGWPGNVRQLENEIQRALVLADDVIREEHLSAALREGGAETDELDLKAQVEELERTLITRALERAGGNQTRAAKLLGVSRYGLQKMLKRLGSGG